MTNNYIKATRYRSIEGGGRVDSYLYPFDDRDQIASARALAHAKAHAGAVLSVWRPIRAEELPVIGFGGGFGP